MNKLTNSLISDAVTRNSYNIEPIRMRNGKFTLMSSVDCSDRHINESIDVVILGGSPAGTARTFFDKPASPGCSNKPVCYSLDGMVPCGEDAVSSSCTDCPKSISGSGRNGFGMACRRHKNLIVYLDHGAESGVYKLRVTENSLVALTAYAQSAYNDAINLLETWTTIAIIDAKYSKLSFAPGQPVNAENIGAIIEAADSDIVVKFLQ